MERDSESVTAAFHGRRRAVGGDCAPADAWSSSEVVVAGVITETLAGARGSGSEGGATQRPTCDGAGRDVPGCLVYASPGWTSPVS